MKRFLLALIILLFSAIPMASAQVGVLPPGYIGAIQCCNTPGQYSTYTYTFTPTQTGSDYILFAFRQIAKMKNSVNTNLLIMDEVFDSSLDGFGTEEFLKIIQYVIKDANIFVISHKDGLQDKFDNVIKFEKVKG